MRGLALRIALVRFAASEIDAVIDSAICHPSFYLDIRPVTRLGQGWGEGLAGQVGLRLNRRTLATTQGLRRLQYRGVDAFFQGTEVDPVCRAGHRHEEHPTDGGMTGADGRFGQAGHQDRIKRQTLGAMVGQDGRTA